MKVYLFIVDKHDRQIKSIHLTQEVADKVMQRWLDVYGPQSECWVEEFEVGTDPVPAKPFYTASMDPDRRGGGRSWTVMITEYDDAYKDSVHVWDEGNVRMWFHACSYEEALSLCDVRFAKAVAAGTVIKRGPWYRTDDSAKKSVDEFAKIMGFAKE